MRDEHDDRTYQAFRQELGRDVARLVRSVVYPLERLHARLYEAPWLNKHRVARQECGKGLTTL